MNVFHVCFQRCVILNVFICFGDDVVQKNTLIWYRIGWSKFINFFVNSQDPRYWLAILPMANESECRLSILSYGKFSWWPYFCVANTKLVQKSICIMFTSCCYVTFHIVHALIYSHMFGAWFFISASTHCPISQMLHRKHGGGWE
jgi:hypothetical protein